MAHFRHASNSRRSTSASLDLRRPAHTNILPKAILDRPYSNTSVVGFEQGEQCGMGCFRISSLFQELHDTSLNWQATYVAIVCIVTSHQSVFLSDTILSREVKPPRSLPFRAKRRSVRSKKRVIIPEFRGRRLCAGLLFTGMSFFPLECWTPRSQVTIKNRPRIQAI